MYSVIKPMLGLIVMLLLGCINKPFQPAPEPWEIWQKRGASIVDVRRAMLECGYDFAEPPESINSAVVVYQCMEKDGFKRKKADRIDLSFDSSCRNFPEIPECKLSIDEVPSRDSARRLNSKFCKKYQGASICQP